MPFQPTGARRDAAAARDPLRKLLDDTAFVVVFVECALYQVLHVHPVRGRAPARVAHARHREDRRAVRIELGKALVDDIGAAAMQDKVVVSKSIGRV